MATTIAYANSNTALLKTAITGSLEGRGAATPNLASRTVDETTLAHNGSVCTWAAENGFNGIVVSGGAYSSASGLVATFTAPTAWILQTSSDPDQIRRVVASTSLTVTLEASSDNYVYLKLNGTLDKSAVATGAAAPTLPADVILLANATTNSTTVTGTPVDKRVTTSSAVSKHYRSTAFWPFPSSTTVLSIPPGVVELGGTLFEQTGFNSLDITQSGNFVSGARTSNVWTYALCGESGGAISFKLTTSAPSAMTIVGGATSGSTGRLQYRTIGGTAYRYLGAARTSTTGVFKRYSRSGPNVILHKNVVVLNNGAATSFTAVDCSATVPKTSTTVRLALGYNPDNTNGVTLRATGSSADGRAYETITSTTRLFEILADMNTSQSLDYKTAASTTVDLDILGWVDDLD